LRLNEWAKLVDRMEPTMPRLIKTLTQALGVDEHKAAQLAKQAREVTLRMRGFDSDSARLPFQRMESGPPAYQAAHCSSQARMAHSAGDLRGAIEHMRTAIAWKPDDPSNYFALAAYLGEAIAPGHHEFLPVAIEACLEAARLDPAWNRPPTEIGIILMNAGLLEEAEEAFARAQGVAEEWDHFHHARGVNRYWRGRFAEAVECLRRSLQLAPTRKDSKAVLLVCLEQLYSPGTKEIRSLRKELEHEVGRGWRELIPRPRTPKQK
jgi:Flp pilus assembly protein TadD